MDYTVMLFLPGPNRIKLAPAQTKSLALGSDSPIHLFYFPLSIEVCSSQICSSQIFFVQIHPMLSFFSCWNQNIFLFSNNMGAVICLNLSQLPACSKSRNRTHRCSNHHVVIYVQSYLPYISITIVSFARQGARQSLVI